MLLVEDSLIIALDAEDILRRLGADHVVTARPSQARSTDRRRAARRSRCSTSIWAIETSFPIADRLLELGIPFLFATGYGEQAQLPADMAAAGGAEALYAGKCRARVGERVGEDAVRDGRARLSPSQARRRPYLGASEELIMADLSGFPITSRWPARDPERIQLYSFPTPNGVKVSIMLEELGLPYEAHPVNIMKTRPGRPNSWRLIRTAKSRRSSIRTGRAATRWPVRVRARS